MAIEFFALTRDGRPVADVRDGQLTLKVDGRPRRVESLQWVAPDPTPTRADLAAPTPLPPPFGSNILDSQRAIVLVLDDDSFRPGRERPLREAAGEFLVELPANDRVALATVPYGGLKVDFTTDRRRITQALSQIVGQATPGQTGSQLACRTRDTLNSLTGLLGSLRGGQGPTTVVFFSSALAGPRRDAPVTLAPGACELTHEHFRRVAEAAAVVRAHFYLMQPDEVALPSVSASVENIAGAGFTGSDNPMEGLEHLAGVTGGQQIQLTSARESGLRRVARETSGYYVLRFTAERSDRNGAAHAVDIRIAREDVVVHARPAVFIANAQGGKAAITPRAMLRDAKVFRDLPLRAIAYVSENAPDLAAERRPGNVAPSLKILALVEAVDPSVRLASAAAGLFDAKGSLTAQWTANSEELAANPVMTALVVSPGTYRLRMTAVSVAGLAGSADYEVVAELATSGPLRISSLVLGIARGAFRPMLQFSTQPVATAYLEIYGASSGTAATVAVELANSVDGPPLLTLPGAIAETPEPNRRIATAAIPVGGLPPGDYAVRAIVSVPGQPAGRVVRTLRKVSP